MPCPFSLFRSKPKPSEGPVQIGWIIDTEKAGFIWSAPQKLPKMENRSAHAKAVAYCPAVVDHEARLFQIPCPIDLHLRFAYNDKKEPMLINAAGEQSTIRPKHLNNMLAIVNRSEWRHPERPLLQLITPYLFVSDQPAYMSQLPPFCHYIQPAWPGVLLGGRMPVHLWPRHLMWAFEWHDTKQDLIIKRGDPWFYVHFETEDPGQHVRLLEAEMTPALREYINGMTGVTNYVNRTFSLFSIAKERRPETLLTPKSRKSSP